MLGKPLRVLSLIALFCVLGSCASSGARPIDDFVDAQKARVSEKSVYVQADFDFWAAAMEPTRDDIDRLKAAWRAHGDAFPESEAIKSIERGLSEPDARVILVSLFMTEYEKADLKDKKMGWSVSPVPDRITELSYSDLVLRTLMPVRNSWARFFLLHYPQGSEGDDTRVIVSDRTSKVELPLRR